jgi:type VII secretion-associated serine protease mycosin
MSRGTGPGLPGSLSRFGAAVVSGAASGLLATGILLLAPPPPAAAQGACVQPGEVIKPVPWHQKLLAPDRVWPLATGAGVKVAVLDSGVDANYPQLTGRVLPGQDFLYAKGGRGDKDCVGHGTAVASLIAAKRSADTGFRGLAPDAIILPGVVSEQESADQQGQSAVTPAEFANAIRWAVGQGAKVINLSLTFKVDYPEVREAVRAAVASDVVVVAAAGNAGRDGNPTPYPAAYDNVIGVGAVDQTGTVLPESGTGTFVDLVAPGDAIVAATPGHGHQAWRGTSFATPLVAATVALVRQYWPTLTAKQVTERLLATASPAPGGAQSARYGRGMVDPYRAVTERLISPAPKVKPTPIVRQVDPAEVERDRRARYQRRTALIVGTAATVIAALGMGGMWIRRRGRLQQWQPFRTALPPPPTEDPGEAPRQLFEEVP